MTKRAKILIWICGILFFGMVGLGMMVGKDGSTADDLANSGPVYKINSAADADRLIADLLLTGTVADCSRIKVVGVTDHSTGGAISACVRKFAVEKKDISMCNAIQDDNRLFAGDQSLCVSQVIAKTKNLDDCKAFFGDVKDSCFSALATVKLDKLICTNVENQNVKRNCELGIDTYSR